MNAIFNTLLRANFRCGRMSHFRAILPLLVAFPGCTTGWGRIGTALGPNVTAQAYKTGKYAR